MAVVKNTSSTRNFAEGSVAGHIVRMSLPMMAAQLVNILYNVVDRIYISNIPVHGSLALAGVGVAMPVISLVTAFSALLGQGGVPLCSIARGRGDTAEAERYLGHSFQLLLAASAVLMALCWGFMTPILRLFGATAETVDFAAGYLRPYMVGTPFAMLSLGLNGYINSQGFPRRGMLTVLLGALANIVLDPIFIFALDMGVAGAAWATVISQLISALWCLSFLRSRKAELRIHRGSLGLRWATVRPILGLGVTGFCMQLTNALVQTVCNRQLVIWGGELYISAFVIINSLRLVFMEIVMGFSHGMQPVLGFNHGAGEKRRELECIRFSAMISITLSVLLWLAVLLFPEPMIRLFTADEALLPVALRSVRIYFIGFVLMSLQAVGQSTFLGLGQAKKAVFFSLLRKAFLVVPLVLWLPGLGLGVDGVFWSEPISDLIGGGICFTAMLITVYIPTRKELRQ